MGVEPTGARCSRPPTDFEDRGAHRDTSTPTGTATSPRMRRDKPPGRLYYALHTKDTPILACRQAP